MKRVFASNQIVGSFAKEQQAFEVCATSEANFDEARSELELALDSFIRPVNLRSKEVHFQQGWLPKKRTVREHVSAEEAPDLARDIFSRWVRTLRESIPTPVRS